jgi:hypothetical protein
MLQSIGLRWRAPRWLAIIGLIPVAACTGVLGGPDDGFEGMPNGPGSAGSSGVAGSGSSDLPPVPNATERGGTRVVPTTVLDNGRVVLRRLNRTEYDNTVRDLLGSTSRPAMTTPFASDDVADGFDTLGKNLVMSLLLAEQLDKAADVLVAELLARPENDVWRSRILSCQPTAANASACFTEILSAFMKRAYRRPVADAEVQTRVALAASIQQSSGDVMTGLTAALKSVLLSPNFLYRPELGDPTSPAAAPLDDFALASRLSYFLWATMPDQALMDAASASKLAASADELNAQVDRMLADPKADDFIESFAGQWLSTRDALGFVPDPEKFPDYDDALRVSQPEETLRFFTSLIAEKKPLTDLVLADYTFVNERLAEQYELAYPTGQTGFTKVSLAGTPRLGILGQQTYLTVTSFPQRTSPVKRAEWVLEHLLCDPPPVFPGNIPPFKDEIPPGLTLRQAFELHRQDPACASCHKIMDPIGFALENFDAMGKYRTTENGGAVIDTSGQMSDGTLLTGSKDLATAVATDADFAICVAKQMLTYAVGRSFSETEARAYAGGIGVKNKEGDWNGFIKAVVASEAFRTRRGEAL